MNNNSDADRERLLELLVDRSLFGLDEPEQAELAQLQAVHQDIADDEMDSIVALVSVTSPAESTDSNVDGDPNAAMPTSLKDSILRNAGRLLADTRKVTPSSLRHDGIHGVTQSKPSRATAFWRGALLVACTAAATLLAVTGLDSWKPTPRTASTVEQRADLLEQAADVVKVDWTAMGDDPITGDVVWSKSQQAGFMTFKGLPINDPKLEQYQLWIFDTEQDEKYPIDGGVFDVASDEATVPIAAKIKVADAAMFAITIEKPGGVVVSDRSRLPVLAKIE